MGFSGFASLGYQIVWTRQCALWLGHESAAVLAVVAAFFGGLAIGSALCGDAIERSARPLRWYAACEAVIGLWGLVLAFALPALGPGLARWIGVSPSLLWQWSAAFGGTFVLLLPATAAMGATLPLMERLAAGLSSGTRSIASVYAANTLGAMVGVLGAAFWLVPGLGLANTAGLCAALNLGCAGAAVGLFGRRTATPAASGPRGDDGREVIVRLAATGFIGIGYEVLVVRVLSQVAEDTVYTYAMLLAIYLAGTAAGAAAWQRLRRDGGTRPDDGAWLALGLSLACMLGTATVYGAESLHGFWLHLWGRSMAAALGAESVMALAAFALPTVLMGALFSHLGDRAREAGISYGRSIGVNTAGAAFAPVVFGVWLAPGVGPARAFFVVAAAYAVLAVTRGARPVARSAAVLAPSSFAALAMAVLLAAVAPSLAFVDVPEGGRIVRYDEGSAAAVSVVEDAAGVSRLRIDNREQEGSSDSGFVDGRQALLPLLLHPAPGHALFLGLGTGVTAATAAADPSLQVDAVELLPGVIDASPLFTTAPPGGAALRLRPIAADARRFVRASHAHWDVVVADNFHPARAGSGALYTVEHFRSVHERLAPHGLFCQWLPLHQLDLDTLRSIVASFLVVYPEATAILANNSLETPVLGLVGRQGSGERLDFAQVAQRLEQTTYPTPLPRFGIDDAFALLGSTIAGPAALAHFASGAPLNTDDRPIVAYRAPRMTYAPDSLPRERLVALLRGLEVQTGDVLASGDDPEAARRLRAYWSARNAFIEAGRRVRPSSNAAEMLAQVQRPLLDVLRISPDFRPAYDPLLRMATALARDDPLASKALLAEIATIRPARR